MTTENPSSQVLQYIVLTIVDQVGTNDSFEKASLQVLGKPLSAKGGNPVIEKNDMKASENGVPLTSALNSRQCDVNLAHAKGLAILKLGLKALKWKDIFQKLVNLLRLRLA